MKDPKINPDKAKYIYYIYDTEGERYLTRYMGRTNKHKVFYRACDAKIYWSLAYGANYDIHSKHHSLTKEAATLFELESYIPTRYYYKQSRGIRFDDQTRYVLHRFKLGEKEIVKK